MVFCLGLLSFLEHLLFSPDTYVAIHLYLIFTVQASHTRVSIYSSLSWRKWCKVINPLGKINWSTSVWWTISSSIYSICYMLFMIMNFMLLTLISLLHEPLGHAFFVFFTFSIFAIINTCSCGIWIYFSRYYIYIYIYIYIYLVLLNFLTLLKIFILYENFLVSLLRKFARKNFLLLIFSKNFNY